jgi:KipI family sensor histidine kinase inhibitor
MTPTVLPCGDQALSFQLGDRIDATTNARVIALARAAEDAAIPGILDLVPTYRALLVRYDPEIIRGAAVETVLHALHAGLDDTPAPGRLWHVPVLYGGEVGQDLDDLARLKGMTPAEVIALHSGAEYRVYMIGFAPGFAYLGGLPEVLHTPRLATPRQLVAAGAIGIGGAQASVNSVPSPSGWRYIGWTPLRLFDLRRENPFLFAAGDRVRFCPVDAKSAANLARRIEAGESVIAPEVAR